jgi:hypothetical protein
MMSNTHTVNESLLPNKPFALMKDFVAVAPVNYADLVLVVHPSVPVNSLKELMDMAKAKPKGLNYASSGPGTPYHMAGEMFNAFAGLQIVHVPYKGSAGARTDVMGGQVHMMFDAIPTMAPNIRAGKVRGLATTGAKRSSVLPELPTMGEAGVDGRGAVLHVGHGDRRTHARVRLERAFVVRLNHPRGLRERLLRGCLVDVLLAKETVLPVGGDHGRFADVIVEAVMRRPGLPRLRPFDLQLARRLDRA